MKTNHWQPLNTFDAIVFDCDGTLSQIEGIGQLAEDNGVTEAVRLLTEKAMSETGITPDIYHRRLDLVRPTAGQLAQIGTAYYQHLSPDADRVVNVFNHWQKPVYIVSAGIQLALEDFADILKISRENVFGVPVYFDEQGNYQGYDQDAWMANQQGKKRMIEQLKHQHRRVAFIGDGMNDVEAASAVDRFIGYGGAFFRENIAARCSFYIKTASLAAVLPLCLTASETKQLTTEEKNLYNKGLKAIESDQVLIR